MRDPATRALLNHLVGAVRRQLRYADALALQFSGGLASSVLAQILAQQADVTVFPVTVAAPRSQLSRQARRSAQQLRLPLIEVALTRERLRSALTELGALLVGGSSPPKPVPPPSFAAAPPDFGVVALCRAVLLYLGAQEARLHTHRLIMAEGASEFLPRQPRHRAPKDAGDASNADPPRDGPGPPDFEPRIARHWRLQLRYPYRDPGLLAWGRTRAAQARPGVAHVGERLLQEVGSVLHLPPEIVDTPEPVDDSADGSLPLFRELAQERDGPLSELLTHWVAASTLAGASVSAESGRR